MRRFLPFLTTAIFLAASLWSAVAAEVEPPRKFLAPPAVGVHPRVLLNAEELPAWRSRLQNTASGRAMVKTMTGFVNGNRKQLEEIAAIAPGSINADTVAKYWVQNDARNEAFFLTWTLGWLNNDPALTKLAMDAATSYCRIILKSKELGAANATSPLHTGGSKEMPFWHSHDWDVGTGFLNGGMGLALTYDFAFNQLTPEQRTTMRRAIAAVTTGRRSWGMGAPAGRIISNHSPYHGHLPIMALAIEGEEGYDPEIYPLWVTMLGHYMDRAIYVNGAAQEDSYPLGTSFRDSAATMVAMARRGTNYFEHPHFQAFLGYVQQSLEPFPDGVFLGHGGGSGNGYPSFWAVIRYALPESPLANHLWRSYAGEDYSKALHHFQSYVDLSLFCSDWNPTMKGSRDVAELGLPLSVYYPGRGEAICRSDWSANALYVQLDARSDGYFVGHDNADRGTFTVSALGKTWAPDLDWMGFQYGDEHSLVQIDGKSEAYKTPSAKWLESRDVNGAAIFAVDLKYCYDWQWPEPWPKMDQKFPPPWELEPSDPRALGTPDTPDLAWVPHRLHDEPNFGYVGLNYWRKPYNPVQKAFRSLSLVRGKHPYLLVVDDIRKDDAPHRYDWLMQLSNDVEIKQQHGDDTVLGWKDTNDKGRLLVRVIPPVNGWGNSAPTAKLESYAGKNTPGKGANKGEHMPGTRLVVSRDGVIEPSFKVMIFPFEEGNPLPATHWNGEALVQQWPGEESRVTLQMRPDGRTAIVR